MAAQTPIRPVQPSPDIDSDSNPSPSPPPTSLHCTAAIANADPDLVTWTDDSDPAHPRNWTRAQKRLLVTLVSLFTFISPVASTMMAPALDAIDRDLDVRGGRGANAASALLLSIFLLGYAVGPLVLAPLSETHGRVRVLLLANGFFLAFTLAGGFARTQAQMTAVRFLAGVGGSATLGIGPGVVADCYRPEERGAALAWLVLMPVLGPAVGPVLGAYVLEGTGGWRWMFWATAAVDGGLQVLGLLFLRESWGPEILRRRKVALQKKTRKRDWYTEEDRQGKNARRALGEALLRPVKLLATQVVVPILATYSAVLYGSSYLVLSTYSALWTNRYKMPVGVGSLNYISLALGSIVGVQIFACLNDRIFLKLKGKHDGRTEPEFRLPVMAIGAFITPFGLALYGWSAQYTLHFLVTDFGAALFTAGFVMCSQSVQLYVIDTYTTYAASATGAVSLVRSLFGTAFPLFGPDLYERLGYGWGTMVLVLVAVVLGWPAPILLWRYGPLLRSKSLYAAEKVTADEEKGPAS